MRAGYSSGTPALGVGTGNVAVIVDDSADCADAARKIMASKIFDNATSCSSENAVIVHDKVYDRMIEALSRPSTCGVDEAAWPDELTPELADILGRQCFMFIKLSQVYRAAGYEIPTSAEAEQAFFLHRLLGHWFRHGSGWAHEADKEFRTTHDKALATLQTRGEGR